MHSSAKILKQYEKGMTSALDSLLDTYTPSILSYMNIKFCLARLNRLTDHMGCVCLFNANKLLKGSFLAASIGTKSRKINLLRRSDCASTDSNVLGFVVQTIKV